MAENKIQNTFGRFQSNAWPAMLDKLAADLGVKSDALLELDLGFAPVVQFKKGPNYDGWWVIPERDATGVVIGMSLRSQSGMKVMFPGSKHGLAYPVNPDHQQGQHAYRKGKDNWVRTMDAGIECPICGKPDGCLLSAEDPEDPQAVTCRTIREGSERPSGWGYLHIRKESGRLNKNASPLPPSDRPMVVVEGMTDTAAALSMGLVAVGRPSNLACMDMLKDLVRGRKVIILGENDDIDPTTGKRPGHEGMVATYQSIKSVTTECTMTLPPEHFKDLRTWYQSAGLTADEVIDYARENARQADEQIVLPDPKPLTAAKAYLDSQHRMAGRYTLRYRKGQWLRYTGARYEEVDPETEIRGPLYGWAHDKYTIQQSSNGSEQRVPVIANTGWVNNTVHAMLQPCPIREDATPCWINGVGGPDPQDLIPFSNGLLWLSKYFAGAPESEYLLDPTPDYFTTFALPFPFDPTAACPFWMRYLRSTLGDEPGKIRLARQWMGYCLTPDTSMHKLMLLRGPRRSGKSTFLHILRAIVGREQAAAASMESLTQQFGLQSLVGAQVATLGDVKIDRSLHRGRALEVLLNIVGEDPIQIDRKFKEPLKDYTLGCRFTMAANELPDLPDDSGALESRLLILDFKKRFEGKEDWNLKEKLEAEAAGIVVWALEGRRQLTEAGRFDMPESSQEALREWRTATSPMAAFVEECCDEGGEVVKGELYDAWSGWSSERGYKVLPKSKFYERIRSAAPHIHSDTYMQGNQKRSVYKGLTLRDWAHRRFLGRP